jgi:protein arginine kinase activator
LAAAPGATSRPDRNEIEVSPVSKSCDHCDQPAVVHETVIKAGVAKEVHLCEMHAAEFGYGPSGSATGGVPVAALLTAFVASPSSSTSVRGCPGCGTTLGQIRQSGTLGCPECYTTFEGPLAPIVQRAQAGAAGHVGRAPTAATAREAQVALRAKLVRELEEAVASEQYERAARIRDRIHELVGTLGVT